MARNRATTRVRIELGATVVVGVLITNYSGLARALSPAQGAAAAQQAGAVSALVPRGSAERAGGEKDLAVQDAIFWNDVVKTFEAGRLRIQLQDQSVLNIGVRSR